MFWWIKTSLVSSVVSNRLVKYAVFLCASSDQYWSSLIFLGALDAFENLNLKDYENCMKIESFGNTLNEHISWELCLSWELLSGMVLEVNCECLVLTTRGLSPMYAFLPWQPSAKLYISSFLRLKPIWKLVSWFLLKNVFIYLSYKWARHAMIN